MFDEIIREIEKLSKPRKMVISVPLDDKGFYDRECQNSACGQQFKVHFEDWKNKVGDKRCFCPFCRHEADATEWNTPEQTEHFKSAAVAEMSRLTQGALRRGVSRSRPRQLGGGLFKIGVSLSFSPGRIPPVIVARASEAMRQDFTCETCGFRFASVGASFFCPACGHNSALTTFDMTLETVEKTVRSLTELERSLQAAVDEDTATNAKRQILEDQFARLVGAFERVNEALFDRLPNASQFPKKGSIFQRLDDASDLWLRASGKSYTDFIGTAELQRMRLLFQRRHVLSHRQGIIDQSYVDKSGDRTYSIGQRLVVKPADVLELVSLMRAVSAGLRTLV